MLKKSTHFLYKLVEPKSKDEDSRRREFILNVILLSSISLLVVATSSLLFEFINLGLEYRGGSPLVVLTILAFFIALYFLSRKGFFIVSSYILIGVYITATTYALYSWGVELTPALLGYALIIIMSGILINTKFLFLITVAISSTLIFLSYLQTEFITSPNLYWKSEMVKKGDAITFVFIFGVMMLVSWLSNREIEKSLKRARSSEADLEKERDMLEVKVEERTCELKKTQLEKTLQLYRFAEFGRTTAGILHDLANPISAVILNLEDLKKHPEVEPGEKVSQIDRALSNIERVKKFIGGARREIQQQKICTLFSPADEIALVLQMLSFKAKKEGVTLEFIPPDDFKTYGNSLKFYRLITGLVANAIDSYDDMLPAQGKFRVVVTLVQEDDKAEIIVGDWGCGIPAGNLSKIFDPLFTTKNIEKGTGIGLFICKEIIEKSFEGKIKIKSREGEGTLARITFPINRFKNDKNRSFVIYRADD